MDSNHGPLHFAIQEKYWNNRSRKVIRSRIYYTIIMPLFLKRIDIYKLFPKSVNSG